MEHIGRAVLFLATKEGDPTTGADLTNSHCCLSIQEMADGFPVSYDHGNGTPACLNSRRKRINQRRITWERGDMAWHTAS